MAVIWELDFYARPLLDENQKKVWEIAICQSPQDLDRDPTELFRYARYCKNTEVNSLTVKAALEEAIDRAGQTPAKIRFFRQGMKNAISLGCKELGIPSVLSRRTYTLNEWLQERMEMVYPQEPGYQADARSTAISMPVSLPRPLPDALEGRKWSFVTLELAVFQDLPEWDVDFQDTFSLQGLNLSSEIQIPGLLVFSPRAKAIAAWMSGLEVGLVTVEKQVKPSSLSSEREEFPDQVILETGVGDRWVFANLADASLKTEGQNFEAAKATAQGVHFLALQTRPDEERFAGFWLMRQMDSPDS